MPEIDLRPGFFMFAIVLAALDRSGSVLPILYAMGVHELAHVVMMLACGGRVRRLTLRFADLRIDAAGLGYRQELLAALAGPLVNLVCGVLFCMRSPAFAAYSLMLGIYNLLPVWPLDGGRAVRCALAQHLPLARAEAVSRRSSFAVCAALIWPLSFTLPNVLRAAGDAKYTMEVSVFSMWVFRVASSYFFAGTMGLGVLGVWIGMYVDWAFRTLLFVIRYRRGRWLEKRVV